MKVEKITDVLQMEDDMQVLAVAAVVESIYEQKRGTSSNGDWAIQNMSLRDEHDGKIKIRAKVKDREPLPLNIKGKKIYITCTQGSKGWHGIKVKLDEYPKGKFSKILSITPTAEITFPGDVAAPQAAPEPEPENEPPPQRPAPVKTAPAKTVPEDFKSAQEKGWQAAVTKARVGTAKYANMYWVCLLAGEYNFNRYKEHFGEPMTADQFQAMVSTLFIQAAKDGLIEELPAGNLEKYLPARKPAPAPETSQSQPE